ncbi:MAG: GIY-YIG nuclease family protein [Verrucomicrobia bacterium]|nr:GIY-YIG nuclease family protein [Verrucomicrobiota bacterium]
MSSGYLYILTNGSFARTLLKIGRTARSVEARAKELSDKTGMPKPFKVAYSVKVPDCDKAEKQVHKMLERFRTTADREFFEVSLDAARDAMWQVAQEQILYRLAVSEWELKVSDPKDESPFHAHAREARNEIRRRLAAKDPNAWDPAVWEGYL